MRTSLALATVLLLAATRADAAPAEPPGGAPAPAGAPKPAAVRFGPLGGRLLPLGDGGVEAELLHDAAAGRLTVHLRNPKDGTIVPVVEAPVVFVLVGEAARRLELESTAIRPELLAAGWRKSATWTRTDDAFKAPALEGILRVKVADAGMEADLGRIDMATLLPPIEERVSLHGGRVIVFSDGAFHAEVVHDAAAGTLSAWFLHPKDKTPIPLGEPPVADLEVEGGTVVVPFLPLETGKTFQVTGKADAWRGTHEALKKAGPLRGRMRAEVADRPYSAPLSPFVGPRGGRVVAIRDGGRVEIVRDRTAGTVTVYLLDGTRAGGALLEEPVVVVRTSASDVLTVPLAALEGVPGAFRASHAALRGATTGHRVVLRAGEPRVEEEVDPLTGTPPPGSPADQDAIPGDHDPGREAPAPPEPPTNPGDEDAIPGDTDPGSDEAPPPPMR
jgi:hypothetical protein